MFHVVQTPTINKDCLCLMKVPKTYQYIDSLKSDSRLDAPVIRDPSDPKRIRRNVAKVPKPSKAELMERHRSPSVNERA